jgi:hypothetical protein
VADVKTWRLRLLVHPDDIATEPLAAEDIAKRLWAGESNELTWAEPLQPAEPALAPDVPEVRRVLLADPTASLEQSSSIQAQTRGADVREVEVMV